MYFFLCFHFIGMYHSFYGMFLCLCYCVFIVFYSMRCMQAICLSVACVSFRLMELAKKRCQSQPAQAQEDG